MYSFNAMHFQLGHGLLLCGSPAERGRQPSRTHLTIPLPGCGKWPNAPLQALKFEDFSPETSTFSSSFRYTSVFCCGAYKSHQTARQNLWIWLTKRPQTEINTATQPAHQKSTHFNRLKHRRTRDIAYVKLRRYYTRLFWTFYNLNFKKLSTSRLKSTSKEAVYGMVASTV